MEYCVASAPTRADIGKSWSVRTISRAERVEKIVAKNVILIMSGGVGQRFGSGVPKQYCMMGDRSIIEYAIDAARF